MQALFPSQMGNDVAEQHDKCTVKHIFKKYIITFIPISQNTPRLKGKCNVHNNVHNEHPAVYQSQCTVHFAIDYIHFTIS